MIAARADHVGSLLRAERPAGLAVAARLQLLGRIEEAARVIDRERLSLGTQCGFATSVVGNRISVADQERKLTTSARTARRAWPDG